MPQPVIDLDHDLGPQRMHGGVEGADTGCQYTGEPSSRCMIWPIRHQASSRGDAKLGQHSYIEVREAHSAGNTSLSVNVDQKAPRDGIPASSCPQVFDQTQNG